MMTTITISGNTPEEALQNLLETVNNLIQNGYTVLPDGKFRFGWENGRGSYYNYDITYY